LFTVRQVDDWVTAAFARCVFREVRADMLPWPPVAGCNRRSGRPVGHTGPPDGVWYRPALCGELVGYFATTDYRDGCVLLTNGMPLPNGNHFCRTYSASAAGPVYTPCPCPEVAPAFLIHGGITFAALTYCKIESIRVYLWANPSTVRSAVILKWRTFNDEALRQSVHQEFVDGH